VVEEDFRSQSFHAHRWSVALGDAPASILLLRTAGEWAPALVLAIDGTVVDPGLEVGPVATWATDRGDQLVAVEIGAAPTRTQRVVEVFVTAWRVLDHLRSDAGDESVPVNPPLLPAEASYTLRVDQACEEPAEPQALRISYYHTADEADYYDADGNERLVPVYDASCQEIAEVPSGFWHDSCLQGTGILSDGRMVNVTGQCGCGEERCAIGGRVCFRAFDPGPVRWGVGARNTPVEPLRSWAVDRTRFPLGTVIYAPEWDGYRVPSRGELGGYVHDGCFRADDVGGAITADRVDVFAGTRSMWLALSDRFPTGATLEAYRDSPRCAHLE
jgi:3D (Asp-Asp-Asp) domain-containing protein